MELLLSVKEAHITFGKDPLFTDISFTINTHDKICLIGRNGAGKTTLMNVVSGVRELDGGERWLKPHTKIGYLEQDPDFKENDTIENYVFNGLPEEEREEEHLYLVDIALAPLGLQKDQLMGNLSGGQVRRASLAKALISNPDILLLDEPTNHLDLQAVLWLESYLKGYKGVLICISHDKEFLKNISSKVFWLDRGKIRTLTKGYAHFEQWQEEMLEQEARELENREKKLAEELHWMNRGVTARRKRNVRRVAEIKEFREQLKKDKSSYRKILKKITLPDLSPVEASKLAVEFKNVDKIFTNKEGKDVKILDDFSIRLKKGERIGILGKNGAGKTTFLKLMLKELEQDKGFIRLAKNAEISYFDQKRSDLDPKESIKKNFIPSGGDYINVRGKHRHICAYMKDFLFDPRDVDNIVSTLSGGQKNRLMLAKTLANPTNMLILDEPTNDLDMDTLEMLQEIINDYEGTLFIVSHDRSFLDNTVNKILAFEGEGRVELHMGGYTDYLNNKKEEEEEQKRISKKAKLNNQTIEEVQKKENKPKKQVSYKIKFEYEQLPSRISKATEEIEAMQMILSDPLLYSKDPEKFDETSYLIGEKQNELEEMENRWFELAEDIEG